MLLYLMNIFLSPRLPRQCHGMLRDDRTVGLWCDRLIPRAALYTSPHLALHSATYTVASVAEEGHNCSSCKDLSGREVAPDSRPGRGNR